MCLLFLLQRYDLFSSYPLLRTLGMTSQESFRLFSFEERSIQRKKNVEGSKETPPKKKQRRLWEILRGT